jgi:uncharacterized membrane protein YccC
MAQTPNEKRSRLNWMSFEHAARTAVAATASLLVARLLTLPEAYWAPITALVVTQSTLGAAWTVSWERLVGTLLGCGLGALIGREFGPNALVFGAAVFGTGLLCAALRLDKAAYRFAGITLAITTLAVRTSPAWRIGIERFVEVAVGILVALAFTAVWPGHDRRRV